ncbi:MAG: GGDEF domain-containing protein [Sandaracinaceae bacterium]
MANRRALEELVEQGRPEPLGVVAIDLDHFKAINDEHGHAGGDAVLRHVASLLHAELRGHDRAFRVGGEELLVLLERADWQGTRATAERLRSSLERHVIRLSSERAIRVTASFGVALWMPGHPFDAALAAADEALYRAKHGGRNRVVG